MSIINFTSNFSPDDNIRLWINDIECSDLLAINIDTAEFTVKVIKKGFIDNKLSVGDVFAFIKNLGMTRNSDDYMPYTVTYEFAIRVDSDNTVLNLRSCKDGVTISVENGEVINRKEQKLVSKKTVSILLSMCFIRLLLVTVAVLYYVQVYPVISGDSLILPVVCGVLIAGFAIVSIIEMVQWIRFTLKALRSNKTV